MKKSKKPWNPYWIGIISVFFSFVAGGILAGFNYGQMGKPDLKRKTIKYTLIGFGVLCIIIILIRHFIPELLHIRIFGIYGLGTIINIIVGGTIAGRQLRHYKEWKLKYELGGEKEESEVITEIKDVSKIKRRPIFITILCSFGFLIYGLGFLCIALLIIFPKIPGNPLIRDLHEWGLIPTLIFMLTLILIFAGFIGYWRMRKWGLCLQSIAIIIDIVRCCFLTYETYDILSASTSIIILGIGNAYFKQMI
ncbi:MAG: hypothetical protein AB1630_10220 [bacterium]